MVNKILKNKIKEKIIQKGQKTSTQVHPGQHEKHVT
jgi:hypothetical protein